MTSLPALFADPSTWVALITLIVMEIVLGIDNLVFLSILTNKLAAEDQRRARAIGLALALIMRLILLSMIAWIVGLTAPVIDLGWRGAPDSHGAPGFETAFSWRDLILLAGGLFLVWKATTEIHQTIEGHDSGDVVDASSRKPLGFGAAIVQIVVLDLVFSVDSILTAVGMTDQLPIMVVAVIVAVAVMATAANPLASFIQRNPGVVMLALGFLLMIGTVLIAEAFGAHIPKGYIYTAMSFSAGVEVLNLRARSKQKSQAKDGQ